MPVKLSNRCKRCNKLIRANRVYCSPECHKMGLSKSKYADGTCPKHGKVKVYTGGRPKRFICSKCSIERVKARRKKIKQMAVDYLGGKCQQCGYKKCISALEFHHQDPIAKEFSIADSNTISWVKIKKELDKCELLCANCHREIEDSLR